MREGWKEYKLGELIEIKYGKDHKKLKDGIYPLYGSGGIMRYVEKYLYDKESILIPRKGTLTNLFYLNKPFSTVDTMFWSKINNDLVFPRFLYYMLKTFDLSTLNVGAAVPSLTTQVLNEVLIEIPDSLPTQRLIASILSAYDDLIENNLQRIKLLEEKAQLTYEEWFVRMKFPGHETVKMDEETGLPEGWNVFKLKDCCELIMGQSPKSEFYNENGNGLPFHQGVKDYGFRFPTNSTWSIEGKRYAVEDSILFSVRAPVGRLNVAIEKIILGRGLAAVNHKMGWNSFLFYQLQKTFFKDNLMGGGAIFSSVTKSDVEGIKLLHATDEITSKFNSFASKIDTSIKALTKQNQLLKEARDILLPRLMSGMVDPDEIVGTGMEESLGTGTYDLQANEEVNMAAEGKGVYGKKK